MLSIPSSSVSSFETNMSFNSPEDPSNVVVENEKLHLSSLLVLFENLGCLQKHDNQYVSREAKILFKTNQRL